MRRYLTWAALTALCLLAWPAPTPAADALRRPTDGERTLSLGELTPTADMWFYQQDQRSYHDPREAVRRKAAYRTQQRQLRLAAQQWYGVSNSRPTTASTPFTGGTYGPEFGGGRDPNRWPGRPSATTVIVTPQRF